MKWANNCPLQSIKNHIHVYKTWKNSISKRAIIRFDHGLPCRVKNMALGLQLRQKHRPSVSVFVYWVPRAIFFTRHGRPWSNPTINNWRYNHNTNGYKPRLWWGTLDIQMPHNQCQSTCYGQGSQPGRANAASYRWPTRRSGWPKQGQGSWRVFFVALGKSPPNPHHPCFAMPDSKNRMTYSTNSWWSVDIESMNFNQIIMQGPEYVFWMIIKIYIIEIFNIYLPYEVCWVTCFLEGTKCPN